MKSICIKTNNNDAIEYLLDKLNNIEINNIKFSCLKFKIYTNIIIHYTGNCPQLFFYTISDILTNLVLDVFEKNIVKRILYHDYFYFNFEELNLILNTINKYTTYKDKKNIVSDGFYNYIMSNKSIVLDGFITFRLKDYISLLSNKIDKKVNDFLIEKEYTEFISLLKLYINSEKSQTELVHLIYSPTKSILLDQSNNSIPINTDMFNAKFLSDISFSSNDYVLNTLLSLIPKKIHIHLINNKIDEFITTLILIFENRIELCENCSICNLYKNKNLRKEL